MKQMWGEQDKILIDLETRGNTKKTRKRFADVKLMIVNIKHTSIK